MKTQASVLALTALLSLPTAAHVLAAPAAPIPSVDRTTPRTQNGLTLLALVRGDAQGQYRFPIPAGLSFLTGPMGNGPAGGIGLWVRGSKPPPPRMIHGRLLNMSGSETPTAMGPGMDYAVIPMQCEPQYFNQSAAPGQTPPPLYLLTLPADYPTPYLSPITVTMFDSYGHSARWQLDDLPPSYHAISQNLSPHSTFAQDGVALKVTAWRDDGPASLPPSQRQGQWSGIHYQVNGSVPAGSRWLVRISRAQLEWDALTPAQEQALHMPRYPGDFQQALCVVPLGGPRAASPNPFLMAMMNGGGGMVQTPYADANHYLRLTGQLVRLATTQETVTFHGLNVRAQPNPYAAATPGQAISARPQTVETPSGVSVTLLPLSALPQGRGYYGGMGGVQMLLRFNGPAPGMMPVSLPRSPLAHRYHKPITLTLSAAEPLTLQQAFPVGGYGYPGGFPGARPGPTEYVVTLVPTGHPVPVTKSFGGRRYTTFLPPALPKYINTLTLTLSQQAELRDIPVSFLVPVQRQAPPMPGFTPPRRPQVRTR